jgi:GT2 family glycosyltransferase
LLTVSQIGWVHSIYLGTDTTRRRVNYASMGCFMRENGPVGIVTVTFNSAAVISDFMESLLKQTRSDFVLYVIDSASSDDTLHKLSEYHDSRIVLVKSVINVGIAEGNNIGITAALKDGCESVLLINNDTVFDPHLLESLSNAFRRYQCDMVVPKIMYFDDPQKIWYAGGHFIRLRGSARHFGYRQKDRGGFNQPCWVEYAPACCMLILRDVFSRVGLMDANYFAYFDDTDFCYRAHRIGIRMLYLPSARLLHKVSTLTGGDTSDFTYRHSVRNHVYYCLKHFPRWKLVFFFPAYQIHLLSKFLLLLGKPKTFLLAERAFWEGIRLFRSRVQQTVQ